MANDKAISSKTVTSGAVTVRVDGYVDAGCAAVHVICTVIKGGVEVARIGRHDIDTKVSPENRAALKAACDAVYAAVQSSSEFASAVASEKAVEDRDNDYNAANARVLRAMNA